MKEGSSGCRKNPHFDDFVLFKGSKFLTVEEKTIKIAYAACLSRWLAICLFSYLTSPSTRLQHNSKESMVQKRRMTTCFCSIF